MAIQTISLIFVRHTTLERRHLFLPAIRVPLRATRYFYVVISITYAQSQFGTRLE